jgi:hypothetical protein
MEDLLEQFIERVLAQHLALDDARARLLGDGRSGGCRCGTIAA